VADGTPETSILTRWQPWFSLRKKEWVFDENGKVLMYLKKKGESNHEELNINIRGYFLRKSHLINALMVYRKTVILQY
jgi:hypothetical protein